MSGPEDNPADEHQPTKEEYEAAMASLEKIAYDWIACADRLPPLDHVVECAAKSGYDGSLYRVFAARVDADGEGWLWCDAGNWDLTDLSDFLDTDVIYWREPTPLPKATT